MFKLPIDDLIEEYYQDILKVYPHLTLEEVKTIILSLWNHVKEEMQKEDLPEIRLKYFGVFSVRPSRAKGQLNLLDSRLKNGNINEKQYNKFKTMLKNYLNEVESNNN